MKTTRSDLIGRVLWCAAFLMLPFISARGQGTAFGYQGRLNANGALTTGVYDFRCSVYDAAAAGNLLAGPTNVTLVGVTNGLFSLALDFGPNIFTGPPRWLEIGVRTNGAASFANLAPRQPLLPTPYAIFAGNSSNVVNGAVVKSVNNLKDNVTLAAGANLTITPSGNTLTLAAAGAGGSGIWSVNANNAYYNAGNVGIGTPTPAERLTITDVTTYNTGLRLTGNSDGGTGLALESTAAGGHKYSLFSGASGDSIGAGAFGIYDDSAGAYRFAISPAGNVGIGVTRPKGGLEINYPWDGDYGNLTLSGQYPALRFTGGVLAGNNSWLMQISATVGSLEFYNKLPLGPWGLIASFAPNGHLGLGTSDPQENLTITGVTDFNNGLKLTGASSDGTGLALENTSPGGHKYALFSAGSADGVGAGGFGLYDETAAAYRIAIRANGNVGIGRSNPQVALDVNGTIQGKVLTILGGSDVAEPFPMSTENIPKGSVVIIDDERPGQLKLSTSAYDTRVAGIVSGANGINPGIRLQQEGVLDTGQNVALSGRVYVRADAAFGAIKPGDLLTSSETPGHAMKVSDSLRGQGAILGKAMSALAEGKGMVLVLVTLQ